MVACRLFDWSDNMKFDKLRENEWFLPVIALVVGFLAGMIAGFLLAPAKNGINILSHNNVDRTANLGTGNTSDHYHDSLSE